MCRQFVCFEVNAFQLASLILLYKNGHVVFEYFDSVDNLVIFWLVDVFINGYSRA